MRIFSFYSLDTGLIWPHTYDESHLEAHTPPGHAAIEGAYDRLSQRVQLVTDDQGDAQPVVVDYQPPAPPDDEWQTWAWNTETRRWQSVPTLAALKRAANAPLLAELAALDLQIARPVGEVAQALALAEAPPAAALQRLQEINTAKSALRARLLAISAAESAAELEGV